MKKKLQVFVSSTFLDMQDERQAAVEAILRAGHIPAGMELFAAGDKSQWEVIKKWIDDSDAYMLMLGGRYGSLDPDSGVGYTEKEYNYALSAGKRFFACAATEKALDAKVAKHGRAMMESLYGEKLKKFSSVATSRMCRFYDDVKDIKVAVFESLALIAEDESLPGWIHGSDVVDPKSILEQVERLQSENDRLSRELENLSSEPEVEVSNDAMELLRRATDRDTSFSVRHGEVFVGGATFLSGLGLRETARWRHAAQELLDGKFVIYEKITNSYIPTYKGFIAADAGKNARARDAQS